MTFQTKGGYVFPSVILILTLIISTLVYSASLQKSNVEIINNFKKNLIVEEEIKAIELVILDYLNKLYKSNKIYPWAQTLKENMKQHLMVL